MRLFRSAVLFSVISLFAFSPLAQAQFDVTFGQSNDNGNFGFDDLGTWFADNGYAADASAGADFAKTGYIGYGAGDSDPFFFFSPGPSTFEVVQRLAGNASLTSFGFYTGTGAGKSLTEVLGNGVNGPAVANPGIPFGVYMNTPTSWNSPNNHNFYTDRAENLSEQTGVSAQNVGGDPQALIYQLSAFDYLLAWEDYDYTNTTPGNSDHDFNDAYLKITTSAPDGGPTVTPEPASMALFALGGGALAAAKKRRAKKS